MQHFDGETGCSTMQKAHMHEIHVFKNRLYIAKRCPHGAFNGFHVDGVVLLYSEKGQIDKVLKNEVSSKSPSLIILRQSLQV